MTKSPITLAKRSGLTWENAGQRSAQSRLDNCFRDQAVTNARQLADLLTSADASVVSPSDGSVALQDAASDETGLRDVVIEA
jgi:hypothetical protein